MQLIVIALFVIAIVIVILCKLKVHIRNDLC